MEQTKTEWEISAEIDYQKLDKEYLKLCLDLAEKELKSAMDTSSNATNRGYQALLAIVPSMTLLMSTLLTQIQSGKLDKLTILICIAIGWNLFRAFRNLYEVVFPRNMYSIGAEPKTFFRTEHHVDDEGNKEASLKRLIAIQLEQYQIRVDFMHSQNGLRVHKVKEAFKNVSYSFFILLGYIIVQGIIWASQGHQVLLAK